MHKLLPNNSLYVTLPVLLGLTILLFIGSSDTILSRSWKHAWDLGHIPLFILLAYLVYHLDHRLQDKGLFRQFVYLVVMSFVIGVVIEYLQTYVHRQASLSDVMKDMLGACIAIPLFSYRFRQLLFYQKFIAYTVTVILLIYVTWPVMTAAWDEYVAHKQFPLLSDFERTQELSRWTGNARREISDEVFTNGKHSLKVSLIKKIYSGVELEYFPGDWTKYTLLRLDVYNPKPRNMSLTVSIFDRQHTHNRYRFNDRYTDSFVLQPGWNELNISIEELKNAPRGRQMDISDILGLRLFAVKPAVGDYFYIDHVRLEE